ncbi:non-reducing end alpha-L-arabinofuranosidase family hydrolase [Streptomyces coeruleorubidus]|uniref:non-reducing end alpha-L-arabinofuranosidase family hydrolase n=1 Tax=Streptomyces coeruleorubidus TaxID=116188 RepID=UPI0036F74AA4
MALAPGSALAGTPQPGREGSLPERFTWSSSGPLISPKPDAGHPILAVEDPTVFRYRDGWHVYFTTADTAGRWSLGYTSFARWSEAGSAPQTFLDATPDIGSRYAAAPQIFSFAPQETCNVYRLGDGHLMLVEALATGSDWRRYFRAWTADSPGGTRKPLADTEANPCARSSNVAFEAGQPAWTRDFSHGEMIRARRRPDPHDRSVPPSVPPQGMDPASSGEYHRLPWRLALLTQTNPTC